MITRRSPDAGPGWLVVLRSPVLGPLLAVALALLATPLLHQRGAAAAPIDASAAQDAKQIFLRDCATCHGPDARGTSKGPTLEGQGEAGIDFMISTGRMPLSSPDATMRRHDPAYPPDTIRALVAYIAGLVPGGPRVPSIGAGDLAAGGAIYREQCAACHQAAGEGGALIGQEESPALHRSTAIQIAEAVRTGPGTMPVFGTAAVSDEEMNSLVRYVRELRDPPDPGGQPLWHLGPMPEGAVAIGALALVIVALRRIGARS